MKKQKYLFILIVLIIVSIILLFLDQPSLVHTKSRKSITIQKNAHMDQEKKIDPNNDNTSGKFNDSEYAPICWEIAPVTDLSQGAHTALFGMVMNKKIIQMDRLQ